MKVERMSVEDALKLLGINRGSTKKEALSAVRRLRSAFATDKAQGYENVPEAVLEQLTEKMKDINDAWEIVSRAIDFDENQNVRERIAQVKAEAEVAKKAREKDPNTAEWWRGLSPGQMVIQGYRRGIFSEKYVERHFRNTDEQHVVPKRPICLPYIP